MQILRLSRLKSLNLENNPLGALPAEIEKLTDLEVLTLQKTQLTSLPAEIGKLTQLTSLCLSKNKLSFLPEELAQLTCLTVLDLARNQLTAVPVELGQLTILTELILAGNQLTSIPAEIWQLPSLTGLALQSNQITLVPAEIGQLTSLTKLSLGQNSLKSIPVEIGRLTTLEWLYLGDALLTSLPPEIGQLTSLMLLDLSGNQLTSVPVEIGQLTNLRELRLEKNALPDTIHELNERGTEHLLAYLRETGDGDPLYEAKLLFVGEGKVGKSSLLAALQEKKFEKDRDTTHGIELAKLTFAHPDDGKPEITLNAWDFGGQRIYRTTHQFYYSRRSLYLVLWASRLGPQQCEVDEWIRRIKLRVGDEARVLVVCTHCQTEGRIARIDKDRLRRDHGDMIVGFAEIDSETGHGIEDLKQLIANTAAELPQMGDPFPHRWKKARDKILAIKEPCISFERFAEICHDYELDRQQTATLADLLDILGNIVYYADDDGLKDEVILQPEWMSKAIAYVLEDQQIHDNLGVLEHSRLREIWYDHGNPDRERFDPAHHPFFIRLMEKYDVSYRIEEGRSSLVAEQVPNAPPDLPWRPETPNEHQQLKLICEIKEQPPGIVPWMIVRSHRFSTGRHWEKGMFLEHADHGTAFLELRDREFHLAVRAGYPSHLMAVLSDTLTHLIDQRWEGLVYKLTVPCPSIVDASPCVGRFDLDALRHFRVDSDSTMPCQKCCEQINIDLLLIGFEATRDDQILKLLEALKAQNEQLHADASKERRAALSHTSQLIRLTLKAISSETRDCPRLFTLLPENLRKINPANWGKTGQRLTLWCEHTENPHPVCPIGSDKAGEWVIKRPHDWLVGIAPYAKFVATLLEATIPMAGTATKMMLNPEVFKAVETHVELMKGLSTGLLKAGRGYSEFAGGSSKHSAPGEGGLSNMAEGAGLRQLQALLLELDPAKQWGDLRRAHAPTGDYLWLCPEHYREYDPGLPTIGFE